MLLYELFYGVVELLSQVDINYFSYHYQNVTVSIAENVKYCYTEWSYSDSINCLQFGEKGKLCLVRFLNSTVMVRVGGGWITLASFLENNDPCRGIT